MARRHYAILGPEISAHARNLVPASLFSVRDRQSKPRFNAAKTHHNLGRKPTVQIVGPRNRRKNI